jgi:hypothetical protein
MLFHIIRVLRVVEIVYYYYYCYYLKHDSLLFFFSHRFWQLIGI